LADAIADAPTVPSEELTARQRQILLLIAEGRTAKEMAAALHVSVQTVAFHKYRLMNKLSLRTTAELTRFALQEGIGAS
jgi:DNA-binding NarL/FixJ family response regulator